jgi:plastocyanin
MRIRFVLAASLSAACLASSAQAAAAPLPKTVTVPISSFRFMQMSVTIPAGGSVTWKNLDGEPHTVVSTDGQFRSSALDQGDSFTFRFTKPGTYAYVCSIHPQMRASVIVR